LSKDGGQWQSHFRDLIESQPVRVLFAVIAALVLGAPAAAAPPAPPPLAAYGRLPAIEDASMSPSGGLFALITSEKGHQIVLVRQSADGKIVQGVDFGVNKIRSLSWAGEDHLLIFNTASQTLHAEVSAKPHEWEGLINLDLRTGKAAMLLARSTQYVDAIFGYYGAAQTPDGHWWVYVGTIPFAHTEEWSRGTIYADLTRIDLETGKVETITPSSERERSWLIARNGAVVAHTRYHPASRTTYVYAGLGESKVLAEASGVNVDVDIDGEGRTPGTLLLRETANGHEQLREIPLDGTGPGEVLVKDATGSSSIQDRDTGLTIGWTHKSVDRFLDKNLEARIVSAISPFEKDETELTSYARGFQRMIIKVEGDRNAGRYYLINTAERSAIAIGDVWPDIRPDQVGPVKMVDYKAADGLAMNGVLTLPPGRTPKNLPLVVMPHGGPIVEGDTVGFDWWAQAFASRGYAVFQPNYRGTLGYGEAFKKAAEGEYGRKMQTDISDGVAALVKDGVVDPKRVCIVGASYGGYAALAGVTLQQGLYRCAVSVAGVADMHRMLTDIASADGADRRALDFWRGLSSAKGQDLDAISPAQHAAKADAPVLLIHGENDSVVRIDQSRLMERALKAAGKPVDFVIMPGEDHWLSTEATRRIMLEQSAAFVQKHNPAD